jgi:hypothetical protein
MWDFLGEKVRQVVRRRRPRYCLCRRCAQEKKLQAIEVYNSQKGGGHFVPLQKLY